MTNKDLFELTKKHESQPWWPAGLVWDWEDRTLYLLGRSSVDTYSAERLILGSAVMWLMANRPHVSLDRYLRNQDDAHWFRVCECGVDEPGPSLLAAVLAACDAAYADGGGK